MLATIRPQHRQQTNFCFVNEKPFIVTFQSSVGWIHLIQSRGRTPQEHHDVSTLKNVRLHAQRFLRWCSLKQLLRLDSMQVRHGQTTTYEGWPAESNTSTGRGCKSLLVWLEPKSQPMWGRMA